MSQRTLHFNIEDELQGHAHKQGNNKIVSKEERI